MTENKPNILFVNLLSISLVDIEARFDNKNLSRQSISMPLGIMYISSYIKKHSEIGQVGILDYVLAIRELLDHGSVDDFIEQIAKRDAKFTPDMIAFSLNFSASYRFFEKALSIISNIWPEATVVVGGVHATNTVEQLLKLQNVDFVVRGEAELSLAEFVNQFSRLDKVRVKGIYSKEDLKVSSPELELSDWATDLDDLPFPDWELIDMNKYITSRGRQRDLDGIKHRTASLFTTRGCPFQCTFCSAHTVHGRKVRFRSVKNIIDEIRLLYQKYRVTLIMPEDDLFTADKQKVLTLLGEIKKMNIPGLELQLPAGLSVNTLDEEIVDALISVGLKIGCLAIESGSEHTQRHIIKKNCDLRKARRLVDLLKSKGVIVRCFFIMGFPNETKELMRETVDYAKSLGADWCLFPIATPLVGSEMYDQFVEMECIENNVETWSYTDFDARNFDTPEIKGEELKEFVYRVNLECNFLNNPNKVNRQFEKAIRIYKDIASLHPFHIIAWYCIMECYKGLGDEDRARETEEHIQKLIQTDKRASDMFAKYGDMMPSLNYERAY